MSGLYTGQSFIKVRAKLHIIMWVSNHNHDHDDFVQDRQSYKHDETFMQHVKQESHLQQYIIITFDS